MEIRSAVVLFVLFFAGVVVLREKEALIGWKPTEGMGSTFLAKNATLSETTASTHSSSTPDESSSKVRRRKFVSYTSSTWEQLWLDNVDQWAQNQSICSVLMEDQISYVHDFMNLSCTNRYDETPAYLGAKWCKIDDAWAPIWYDTATRGKTPMLLFRKPINLTTDVPTLHPVRPSSMNEHVMSKFVFEDETTGEQYVEYIEPLVAALRHPLTHCFRFPTRFSLSRSYLVPPPQINTAANKLYFDAGASSWGIGPGGPSLHYFWQVWKRHGIDFDHVYAYEMTTTEKEFYETVPDHDTRKKVHYKQCAVSSDPDIDTEEQPFLPKLIKRVASSKDDYVLFKLDIDSPEVEARNIDFILQDDDNVIDELAWEHHVDGNYLMLGQWGNITTHMSLLESYQYFLKLRQKGIRAHSWV